MEKIMHRRLSWMFNSTSVLPEEMSGGRRQGCTADSLADLASSLEKARATHQTVHVFLDLHCALDESPYQLIIYRLQSSGVCGWRLWLGTFAGVSRRAFHKGVC